MPTPDTDLIEEARELLALMTNDMWSFSTLPRARQVVAALADEVKHARRALKAMTELWDAEHPDDPCGCDGASDDCKHPPTCELCVARLISEGRTKELFEG